MSNTATLYTSPSCSQCGFLKRLLTSEGVAYEVVDVTESAEGLAHVQSLGYSSVPVLVYGDEHFTGVRPDKVAVIKAAQRQLVAA